MTRFLLGMALGTFLYSVNPTAFMLIGGGILLVVGGGELIGRLQSKHDAGVAHHRWEGWG